MIITIFSAGLLWVLFIFLFVGLRLSWGIVRTVYTVILFPLIILFLIGLGLIYLVIPVTIILGLCLFIKVIK